MSVAAARRYARALLELALEADEADQIGTNLGDMVQTWNTNKALRDVFENPSVAVEQRHDTLNAICERMRLSSLLQNTLMVLSDRHRLSMLPHLWEAYLHLAEQRSGRVRAKVTTAGPMPERYFNELKKALEGTTGKTVTLERSQDPSLIGGVVTRIGDKVFDGSLQNQLQDIKDELLAQ